MAGVIDVAGVVHLSDMFIVWGGLCEAAGIVLTVRELVRVEDRAFPERRARLLRLWRKPQARLGLERSTTVHVRSIDSAIAVDSALSIRVDRGQVDDPDDVAARIARLEQVVDDRDREHREAVQRLEGRVADVERRHAERVDALEQRLAREREDERAALCDSLTLQKGYAGLFAFGVVLTTWGSLIA